MVAIQGPTGQAGSGRQDGGGEFRTASRQIEAAPAGQRAAGVARPGIPLPDRYGAADLAVFDLAERRRFGQGGPRRDAAPRREPLYRLPSDVAARPIAPG